MNPQTISLALVERIERLEKQNRRFKLAASTAGLILAAVVAMGQAAPKKTVEADELIITDASGKTRMKLAVELVHACVDC